MHITNTSKPIVATKILLDLMDAQFGSPNGKHFGSSIRRGDNASVLRVSDGPKRRPISIARMPEIFPGYGLECCESPAYLTAISLLRIVKTATDAEDFVALQI